MLRRVTQGRTFETSRAVAALEEDSVVLGDGRKLKASAIVLAVAPFEVARLTGHVTELEPIRAGCLDVALSRLPDPTTNFALGIDEPLYFSVHSSVAKLAPAGAALIHVARYLAPGEIPDVDRLEALLDLMQPGWREVVVEKRFLPKMTVTHAVVPPGGATDRRRYARDAKRLCDWRLGRPGRDALRYVARERAPGRGASRGGRDQSCMHDGLSGGLW